MGHYLPASQQHQQKREIHVLVTGAGPFYSNKINPSNLIASALPTTLSAGPRPTDPTIHIHTTPEPWRVAYKWVREHIPPMLFPPTPQDDSSDPLTVNNGGNEVRIRTSNDGQQMPLGSGDGGGRNGHAHSVAKRQRPNYDVVLFIGMAAPRQYYTLETQAHRDEYLYPDVDGETMEGDELWKEGMGAPPVLATGFDTEDVWRRWKGTCVDEDVRPSDDAGHFLCDFIFYTGLVEYWRRDRSRDRPVMFLHVPGEHDEVAVKRGVKVASQLIVALVQSHVEKRRFVSGADL